MNTTKREDWHKLVEDNQKWVPWVIRHHFSFFKGAHLSSFEEAVAEGNLALVKAAKTWNPNETRSFQNFSRRAIINAILQLYRASKRAKRCPITAMVPLIDYATISDNQKTVENVEYCNNLLDKVDLDDDTRTIMKLYYWEDLNYEEIADRLNISKLHVKTSLYRARLKLRKVCAS